MSFALDAMSEVDARAALSRCCGASRWVEAMVGLRPFGDVDAAQRAASEVWTEMERADILEAFEHHPKIGADIEALRARFLGGDLDWSGGEQSGVRAADDATLLALRDGNQSYYERFGHIFIVCATGKSASEMLSLLEARIDNEPDRELKIAAGEQLAITHLRLAKLETEHPS